MSEQHDEDPGRPGRGAAAADDGFSLSGDEQGIVEDKRPPRAAVLHEVVLYLDQFDKASQNAFLAVGRELMHNTPWQMFTKGILAGWLIAIMVWLLPAAENGKILAITLPTYLIALGGFTHIIVGSVESLHLVFAGELGFGGYVTAFALPTLAGNIVGGSLIFALISHAQLRSDTE